MDDIARPRPGHLREAMRAARIEAAEQSAVVVELRDAERARLEMLNERLDSVFAEVPAESDMFDRGISEVGRPRLWIDAIAHVAMGRDRRTYRFLQDTSRGRRVLAETDRIDEVAAAVTRYVARRIVARERAFGEEWITEPEPLRESRSPVEPARQTSPGPPFAPDATPPAQPAPPAAAALAARPGGAVASGTLNMFLFGILVGMIALLAIGLIVTGR